MENRKKLQVNCATCDVRGITEELLAAYEAVQINTASIVTSPAAQALLGRYAAQINCASTFSVPEGVRFAYQNGSARISPSQTAPEEKVFLLVNGSLVVEPGSEETLKAYAGITVNGSLTCPESMAGLLGMVTVNGSTRTYPDGSIILKKTTALDRFFHLRAKQDGLYYAANQVVALSPDIDFARLTEKNVRFVTKRLLVSESLAEAAVPLFDERADIQVLPDGCAYVDGGAELNEALFKQYGGKLYIDGSLSVTPDSASVLDQISFLRVNGNLRVCRSLRDRALELDLTYDKLRVVGDLLICDRPALELTAGLLAEAEGGVSIIDCANVTIAADVTPELLKGQLVSIADCVVFCAGKEQMDVIQALAEDSAVSLLVEAEEELANDEEEDEDTVQINAAFYVL